jgi:hypothetical protein
MEPSAPIFGWQNRTAVKPAQRRSHHVRDMRDVLINQYTHACPRYVFACWSLTCVRLSIIKTIGVFFQKSNFKSGERRDRNHTSSRINNGLRWEWRNLGPFQLEVQMWFEPQAGEHTTVFVIGAIKMNSVA